eukprot:CAMPEP_0172559662 /NCGR_PEP_ID=MMETSP1067-20121228/85115_1 /TAXON_ID=265564 ORGANISM="Thalassiosira punctigera, Strain Tpunct2005C2" /NCGR_SAMPLE_ID=MMETSP1067 /ASSEMBLY_ACC=CAM_ASM_000444 /LENGTH=896 /DNA_ID=CAMNT_0013349305 /DNA_START=32 /DNA_END=2722 /DNA_ORIENTATION=+
MSGTAEEMNAIIFDEERLQSRLALMRQYIARPIPNQPWNDSTPALIPFYDGDGPSGGGIIIAGSRHASNIPLLQSMNVTAVLNCASGGIARLPVDELKECGIRYAFTNCRQDSYTYPILHERKKVVNRPSNLERMMKGLTDSEDKFICSQHLEVSNSLFVDIRRENCLGEGKQPGNVLFFCVAGQNRSAVLAAATLMLHGKPLEEILRHCAKLRPFVLENVGFQRQLVELEAILNRLRSRDATQLLRAQFSSHWDLLQQAKLVLSKRVRMMESEDDIKLVSLTNRPLSSISHSKSEGEVLAGTKVEIELLIPGLCTMEVRIPKECTIPTVKKFLVQHVNDNLLRHDEHPAEVAKAWVVLAMFGYDDMYDIPLEVEAVELKVQLKRMKHMFGLTARLKGGELHVTWNERCRFALVIFSVIRISKVPSTKSDSNDHKKMEIDRCSIDPSKRTDQVPWTFVHEERPNAPSTLLENTLRSTHLRAWDFVTGESLASKLPIVFSFAEDPRDRRAFMMVSQSANTLQQFHAPGEGDILGMGENAIVHRVQLSFTRADGGQRDEHWTRVNVGLENEKHVDKNRNEEEESDSLLEDWDAAVKRPFSLGKMLIFLQNSSEAGLAKRLRLANLLNSDKRVLYFYGLGLGLSTNAYNQNQYKFELMLLAKYCPTFSTYTMRVFMEEYMMKLSTVTDGAQRQSLQKMHSQFSITSVKVFLVSLLNAFRDLTLMGVEAFDFNHLNNVLVSRDYQSVRLIDIDGNAQGSIQYPSLEETFANSNRRLTPIKPPPQKPSLNVDLNILLPSVIEQLILGKGRGRSFVSNTRSEIWRVKEEDGKTIIRQILMENFYPGVENQETEGALKNKVRIHVTKVSEWFYAMFKKKTPWTNWTHDIYDAMRCIDHLPISS